MVLAQLDGGEVGGEEGFFRFSHLVKCRFVGLYLLSKFLFGMMTSNDKVYYESVYHCYCIIYAYESVRQQDHLISHDLT